MRTILFIIIFILGISISYSQYYDTSAMNTIHLNRTASEGDMYLDTINEVYRIGLTNGELGYLSKDFNWYKIGTKEGATNITDSIYTEGLVQLKDYPETRADDTTTYLNLLYTGQDGTVKSGRREIIPPYPFIDISTSSVGNTFNYYSYYSTQLTNAGLQPIPLANLDFYVFAYDSAVFNTVSISSTGVLTFSVTATTATISCIDVRFYTK